MVGQSRLARGETSELEMRAGEVERVELSVVLPAHNEAGKLEAAVRQTKGALADCCFSYELLIAEDGSTDGTAELASRIAAEDPTVRHIHSDTRLGRGRALNRAFQHARGEILLYMDVDLSTDLAYLKPLVNAVREEHFDLATGSRRLKGSVVKRSFKREALSAVYNALVRLILRSKLRDHQCGFKAFRNVVLLQLLTEVEDTHWFWDTELLVRAQRKGYRIKEIPVKWADKGGAGTKVNAFGDSTTMFSKIIRLYLALRRER
jgi:glycosyltransferase involved in cell wall biosynthesis